MRYLVGIPEVMDLWALVKSVGSVIRIAGDADVPRLADEGGLRIYAVRAPKVDSWQKLAHLLKSLQFGPKSRIDSPLPTQPKLSI